MKRKPAAAMVMTALGVGCLVGAGWIHVKAAAAQWLINSAWDRAQHGASATRPWPWADTTPVARLTLRGAKPLVVLEGSSGRNLAFAPTHDAASVPPGEWGNSVISAHRDTHFSSLERASVGDRIRVERPDGRAFSFSIVDVRVVDTRQVRLGLQSEVPRLTLVTCYPFNAIRPGGPLRFVVTAELAGEASAGAGYTPPRRVARAAALPRPVPSVGLLRTRAPGVPP